MKRLIITLLLLSSLFLLKAQLLPCDLVSITSVPSDTKQEKIQAQRPNQDEIESRKIAWLSAALSLTPAEAARFWPVYNEWNKKMEENMKSRQAALRTIRQLSKDKSVDDKSYAQQSMILINGVAEEAQLMSAAHQAYVAILGDIRTAKLYLAEAQFREMLIRELRQPPVKDPK